MWGDIEQFTAVVEKKGNHVGDWDVRIGCKTGDYTSGSIIAEVGK